MSDDAWFRDLFWRSTERTLLASSIYAALLNRGELHQHRHLTYRCSVERCSVLEVIAVGESDLILAFPRYKTSPGETERSSSESGRMKNTDDGYRRWRNRAAFIESVMTPPLSCDHLRSVPLADSALDEDLLAQHTLVMVRPDGSRYVR